MSLHKCLDRSYRFTVNFSTKLVSVLLKIRCDLVASLYTLRSLISFFFAFIKLLRIDICGLTKVLYVLTIGRIVFVSIFSHFLKFLYKVITFLQPSLNGSEVATSLLRFAILGCSWYTSSIRSSGITFVSHVTQRKRSKLRSRPVLNIQRVWATWPQRSVHVCMSVIT